MSSVRECTAELFVYPFHFKAVSFHDQAEFYLHFSLSLPVLRLHPISQLFAEERKEMIYENGDSWNLDGHVLKQNSFCTSKFPISFNDQVAKFKTGFIAGLAAGEAQRVRVNVQLIRLKENGRGGKRVSNEILQVCLGGEGEHMRRLVFSTKEYISFVDVAFQQTQISVSQLTRPSLLHQYNTKVLKKLNFYNKLAARTATRVKDLTFAEKSDPSFLYANCITQPFLHRFVQREVSDLQYIRVKTILEPGEENAFSQSFLQPSDLDVQGQPVSLLCDHYQCEEDQLTDFIAAEGKLIQLNIRALFQRLCQLTIALFGWEVNRLADQEVTRIKKIISISQNHIKPRASIITNIQQDAVNAHRVIMKEFLSDLYNVTGSQMKQPYVQIHNMKGNREWRGSIKGTLTVFIHGYKGNEYDLSKMKSQLHLLLGCVNFYSIKGLSAEKVTEATIAQLGEIAAKELLAHLALSPAYKRINFIAFSLGGLVARAMLPFLKDQRSRLGLLLTIATPHLGLREVESCFVRVGLCYMRRVARIQAIRELNSERNSRSNRYLLELAEAEGLEWFSSIVLVGSFEDRYVPAYSALAQYTGEDEVTRAMADRLEHSLSRAVRVAVQLDYSESLMDMITRRRSHNSFLGDDSFIRHLFVRLRPLFAE